FRFHTLRGGEGEPVLDFEAEIGRFRVGNPVHGRVRSLAMDVEDEVVVIGEGRVLVLILGAAEGDAVRDGAASTGDQVGDFSALEALVVVDVSVEDDHLGVDLGSQRENVFAQGELGGGGHG